MDRDVNEIILHCSATPEGRDVSTAEIKSWHVGERGWSDIGYHFVIELDGSLVAGRPLEVKGAHVKGRNSNSIGVCYVGGLDKKGEPKDTMNHGQERTFRSLVVVLRATHGKLTLHGHNEFSYKACPSFDVQEKFCDLVEYDY